MLSEKELKAEIELLEDKIEIYTEELAPFKLLEDLIEEKLRMSTFRGDLNIKIIIQQKASKEAKMKGWKNELMIYKRILDGKKMDHLQTPRYCDRTNKIIEDAITELKK